LTLFVFQTADDDEGEPMEIHALEKLKNVSGVNTLLDFYMTRGGYVLVLDRPPPPVKNLLVYGLEKLFRIKEKQLREILRQVIQIMTDIHSAGIYHQDLKHENVLIETKTGKISIIDFGAALLTESSPYKTFMGKSSK